MYFYEKLYMSIGHQVIITLPLSREWSPPVSGTLEEVGLDYAVVKPSGSPEDYTGVGGRWFVPLEDVFLIYHPRYCEECSAE